MQISGVDTVFLKVTDLDRALDWYRRVLGVAAGPRFGDWQVLDVGGDVTFALHRFDSAPGGINGVVALRVDDLDAAIDLAVARGAQPVDPDVTDTGAKRFTTFADPDGNHIQLIAPI
ncbi:MAG TPA: VOC family protein [Acidimicrobiia bacterium]|nr:VOC family protein [Acidimicrobiia bacterium]